MFLSTDVYEVLRETTVEVERALGPVVAYEGDNIISPSHRDQTYLMGHPDLKYKERKLRSVNNRYLIHFC